MATPSEPGSAGPRTLGAAVVGAFVFGLAATVAFLVWVTLTDENSSWPRLEELGKVVTGSLRMGAQVGFRVGLPGALTLGLLTHLLLARTGRRSLAAYVAAGLVLCTLGAVVSVAAGVFDFGPGARLADYRLWSVVGAVAGACGGAAFWLVRRP